MASANINDEELKRLLKESNEKYDELATVSKETEEELFAQLDEVKSAAIFILLLKIFL